MVERKVFTTEIDGNGVAWVTLDVPDEAYNVLRAEHLDEAEALLDQLERDSGLTGVILRSGKADSFLSGADIRMLDRCADAAEASALALAGQRFCGRLEALEVPVVAAIHGLCLGGGLEIALACRYRICTDEPVTRLGLPEVKIGVLPGSGGTQRLPRHIGTGAALDLMLTGRQIRPDRARALGLVDECVPAAHLATAAVRKIREPDERPARPWTRRVLHWITEGNPAGRTLLLHEVRRRTWHKTYGNYPATEAIIRCVEIGLAEGVEAGLKAEAETFGRLAVTPEAQELRFLYFASTAIKKERFTDADPRPLERIGVIGGGLMGAGISAVTVEHAGLPVRVRDPSAEALARASRHIVDHIDRRTQRGALTPFQAEQARRRLTLTTESNGFNSIDLIVEAVFEEIELKRKVLAEYEAQAREGAVFASNTSSLPIASIAEGAREPSNVVGMHYFSPVEKMRLVEVIPHQGTAPDVVATAAKLARAQGKTPLIVADRPGFFVNRILAPYLNEAGRLLLDGFAMDEIDRTLKKFGFPLGPFELLDQVGLSVAARVQPVLQDAFGPRMATPGLVERMLESGPGKFYRRSKSGRKVPDPAVYKLLGVTPVRSGFASEEILDRAILPLLNEAAYCLEEGVIRCPRDGDLAAVLGIGFPPFRGGPFRYMDRRGVADIASALRRHAERFGEHFAPAPPLTSEAPAPFYAAPQQSPTADPQ